MCRLLARESGVLAGGSGGLVVCGSLAWLKQTDAQSAVALIPDTGANYLEQIYNDDWLAEKGIAPLSAEELNEHLSTKRIVDAGRFYGQEVGAGQTLTAAG
jgi:hypothetical protein